MATCELSIELDEDRLAHAGGETVRGTVRVRTDGEVTTRGLAVACRWQTDGSCRPTKSAKLNRVVLRLHAEEKVNRGSGKNRSTYRHTVQEEESEIVPARPLPARLPFAAQGEIVLPADAPPSFAARDNRLTWAVDIRVDIERGRQLSLPPRSPTARFVMWDFWQGCGPTIRCAACGGASAGRSAS